MFALVRFKSAVTVAARVEFVTANLMEARAMHTMATKSCTGKWLRAGNVLRSELRANGIREASKAVS